MKLVTFLTVLMFCTQLTKAQNLDAIQVDLSDDGLLEIHMAKTTNLSLSSALKVTYEWLQDHSDDLEGKITYQNSNTGQIVYKGNRKIYLSRHPSCFQTQMYFTLSIKMENNRLVADIKDIYYKSQAEYGKQGTPAMISYTTDWFSKDKYYKKNRKPRWLNQYYKNGSVDTGNQILASLQNRF